MECNIKKEKETKTLYEFTDEMLFKIKPESLKILNSLILSKQIKLDVKKMFLTDDTLIQLSLPMKFELFQFFWDLTLTTTVAQYTFQINRLVNHLKSLSLETISPEYRTSLELIQRFAITIN